LPQLRAHHHEHVKDVLAVQFMQQKEREQVQEPAAQEQATNALGPLGMPPGAKRKGPLDIILFNAGKLKPYLFSVDFDEDSKDVNDHFDRAIKAQVFGVHSGSLLEHANLDQNLTLFFAARSATDGIVNKALSAHKWSIKGHAALYYADMIGEDRSVFYDLALQDMDRIGELLAANCVESTSRR
jgi:hypothetical protein